MLICGRFLVFTSVFAAWPSLAFAQTKPLKEIVKGAERAVVLIRTADLLDSTVGQGSGFLVDPMGVVVTNFHVIKGAFVGTARLKDGTVREILGIIAADPRRDLAVVKLKGANFPTVRLGNSDTVEVGDNVVVISNPLGLPNPVSTPGIISSFQEVERDFRVLGTTAPASSGSSGGPLLNSMGEVVGVITFSIKAGQNLNFAVPTNYLKPLLRSREVTMTLPMLAIKGYRLESPSPSVPPASSRSTQPVPSIGQPTAPKAKHLDVPPAELYKKALNDYVDGNYDLAVTGFRNYIALYPDTSLRPNAQYWLGETFYSQKRYEPAIAEFDLFLEDYPSHMMVASAMLKKGFAYLELGDSNLAVASLSALITRFPKSQEATLANERLAAAGVSLAPGPRSSRPVVAPSVVTPPVVTPPQRGSNIGSAGAGVSVGSTDPALAYYFVLIQDKVASNWTPPRLQAGTTGTVNLSFKVLRSGQVRELRVETSSEERAIDDSALRAVRLSSPMPPLPPFFKDEELSLQLRFTLVGEKY